MATHSESVRGAHESRSDLVGALGSVESGEPIRRIGRLTDMKGRFLVLVAMAMVVAACANAVDGMGSTLDRGPSGGRAAAASITFASSGPPEPEFTVKADRPFLYLIRHRVTGLVLFAGQVSDPTAGN